MPPIFWIIGIAVIGILFWRASRGNGKRTKSQQRAVTQRELARENYRLRHVLAEISVENYSLKYPSSEHW